LFLYNLCMWYFSSVFMCFPFLCVFMISIVSVMGPYLCPVFSMWFEYPELPLVFFLLLIYVLCIWCGMFCLFVRQAGRHYHLSLSYFLVCSPS
jgi:hypothetical protein